MPSRRRWSPCHNHSKGRRQRGGKSLLRHFYVTITSPIQVVSDHIFCRNWVGKKKLFAHAHAAICSNDLLYSSVSTIFFSPSLLLRHPSDHRASHLHFAPSDESSPGRGNGAEQRSSSLRTSGHRQTASPSIQMASYQGRHRSYQVSIGHADC